MRVLPIYLAPVLFIACTTPEIPVEDTLVNTTHLERLYEAIPNGDTPLGTIWIYCEAPDYHLVDDADEGFTCVDDVSRALVFYSRQFKANPTHENQEKIRTLAEFLFYMQSANGFFYNFLLPGPEINKTHQNSQAIPSWWSWRAFWALSELNLLDTPELGELQTRARQVMDLLVQRMEILCMDSGDPVVFDGISVPGCLAELGADQVGVMLMGLANYYQINPSEKIKALMLSFGDLLLQVQHGDADTWPH